jgi:transcriptional regulator with XRE-family HTH domain
LKMAVKQKSSRSSLLLTRSMITDYFVIMQARSPPLPEIGEVAPYTAGMGRKLTKPRGRHGARLAVLRQDAGLSQVDLAQAIGEKQQTIAYWERSARPPRSDAIPKLARVLGVSTELLLSEPGPTPARPPTKSPPIGRIQKLFDQVSRLPRRQQDKVVEFVSAFIEQYRRKAS